MKKSYLLKTMLLLCVLITGSTSMWADEAVYKTALFGASYNSKSVTSYTATWSATNNGFSVDIANFNNNSNNWDYIKCGRKSYASTATIITSDAIDKAITKVVVTIDAITADKVNSIKLYTSSDKSIWTEEDSYEKGTGAQKVSLLSPTEDLYYKIEFDCAAGSANGLVQVSKVEYYCNSNKADPGLSFDEASYEATYGEEFTPPTLNTATGFNGTVEYTSSDESVARVSDSETGELRIMKGGKTTITATFEGNNDFNAGSASYTLIVTDNRIATTTTQENIVLNLADVATLTRLAPVVKDKDGNVIAYQYDEWPTEMSFEEVSDPNSMIGSFDFNTGEITLNTVTGTVTLKALYNHYGTNTSYQPSECTFTITVVSPLDNIAALTAKEDAGTYQVNLTDAVVTFASGNYAYIQDASGAVAMYKSGHGLTAGDVLNGTATVSYQLRNSNPQITDLSGVTPVAGSAPVPTAVAQSAWGYTFTDVLSQYFQITGATITKDGTKYYVSLNSESVQLYKIGEAISSLDLSKTYTITGFPTLYNTTKELQIFADPEVEADARADAELAWSESEVTIEKDAATYTLPTLTNPHSLAVTYEITGTAGLATESAGVITVDTSIEGTATVTASFAGDETYKPAAVSYTLNVVDNTKKGTKNNPYTVAEVIDGIATGSDIYVKGFIVGEYVGKSTDPRTSGFTTDANIALADEFTATPTAAASCPVALPTDALKNAWGNKTNNGKTIGYEVLIKGNAETYFTVNGIKSTSEVTAVSVPVTPAKEYTTLTSAYPLDFTGTGLTAYIVKDDDVSDSKVTLTEVSKVPANTGLVLKAEKTGSPISVPILTGDADDVKGNLMAGSATETTAIAANEGYILSNGKFHPASAGTLAAGKAYLKLAVSSASELTLDFEGGATKIETTNFTNDTNNGVFYNLNGQRVAQPTKGLYIVNGKKVIIK